MSDRFFLKPKCSTCNTDLDDDPYGQKLMAPIGESIDLTCPKCKTRWRFWMDTVRRKKKLNVKS